MISGGIGTNIKSLNQTILSKLIIPIPPIAEQMRIVSELENLDVDSKKLKSLYTQKLAFLDELKQSLLQKAFAGEL